MPEWIAFVRERLDLSRLTPGREAEVVEDVARQLEDVYQDALARGLSEPAAMETAQGHVDDWAAFGDEIYRANPADRRSRIDAWSDAASVGAAAPPSGTSWPRRAVSGLAIDLVQAWRGLLNQPLFTVVVVVTLGLGIGANAAIFSLLDQVMLRPLPVAHPTELVSLSYFGPNTGRVMGNGRRMFSHPMYHDLADRSRALIDLMAWYQTPVNAVIGARAERVQAELVSGNYFAVLGVAPAAGRLLNTEDDRVPGEGRVVVLSHAMWLRRFGADPAAVGRNLRLNDASLTIVGVAPKEFRGTSVGAPPDLYVPVAMKAAMTPTWDELDERRSMWLSIMGRPRAGVSLAKAGSTLSVTFRQARAEEAKVITRYTEARRKRFIESPLSLSPAASGISAVRDQFSTALLSLMAMVGLLLLIACANVANLLMARAPGRQRDVAVRLALGASTGRIVRRLLVESAMLALGGGAVGLLLASWTGGLLLGALPGGGGQGFTATPDLRVLGFTLVVSLVTALVFGLVPAVQAARPRLTEALNGEDGRLVSAGHARLRRGLVAAQVALSLLLLVAAGLFARTLWNLRALDPGFDTRAVATFSVDPTLSGYDAARTLAYYQRLETVLRETPGVRSAALAAVAPLTDNFIMSTVRVEGYQPREGENMNPHVNSVSPGYFRTLGTRFVSGRDFTPLDRAEGARVAIVNQAMARTYFGSANPIGRRLSFRTGPFDTEIVGVVQDTKDNLLRDDLEKVVYLPYTQEEELSQMTAFVRLAPGVSADEIRRVAERLDGGVPPFDVKSMERQKSESLFIDRMVAGLVLAFGGIATLLAAIGIHGVMSYTVARRTKEIGLRMALGAERRGVVRLIMWEVILLTLGGTAAGLVAALGAGRLVASQLFGLSPSDPATLAAAVVTLLAAALLAGYVPASRAARVDPLRALRSN